MSKTVHDIVPASPAGGVRPAKLIGLKRKTKREGNVLRCLNVNEIRNPKPTLVAVRRKEPFNPFKKEGAAKTLKTEDLDLTEDGFVDKSYSIAEKKLAGRISTPSVIDECANFAVEPKHKANDDPISKTLPIDWSLKTRIRFASRKPFPWRGSLKTSEEATGTTSFVRCLGSAAHHEGELVNSSTNSRFHEQCLMWMQPAIPWVKLFPRMSEESNDSGRNSKPSLFLNDKDLQETLHENWCESFRSVYQLLRTQQCPFFYLCAPNFTALFRATGVAGFSDNHAIITPTTSGLRQSFKDEGIHFTMPLKPPDDSFEEIPLVSDTVSDSADAKNDIENDVPEDAQKEDEPEIWLQSLGLSQEDFPSMNPSKRRKCDTSRSEIVDGRPKSTVLVQGKDLQALYNYLLTNRHCTSLTGPLAGIPPTILAPCAFNSATLSSLKVRQGWVKHQDQDMHCIEICGAILPNQVQGLCSLFSSTQEGQFEAVLANHKPTLAFGTVGSPTNNFAQLPVFARTNLRDAGLSNSMLDEICKTIDSPVGAFTEIALHNYLFSTKHA